MLVSASTGPIRTGERRGVIIENLLHVFFHEVRWPKKLTVGHPCFVTEGIHLDEDGLS